MAAGAWDNFVNSAYLFYYMGIRFPSATQPDRRYRRSGRAGSLGWAALPWLLKPFTQDPEVAAYVIGLSYLFPLYLLLNYLFGLLLSLLRGLSDSFYPQVVVNVILCAVLVPVLMFRSDMVSFYGVVGIFCAAGCVAVTIVAKRWRRRYHDIYTAQCA